MNKRIILAMSGGVDSSVAAHLLKKRGFEVIGLTLRFWDCGKEEGMKKCCGLDATSQAKAVASELNVPHYLIDAHKEFDENVLKRSWNYYKENKTPNPCAFCNQYIKFPILFKYANSLGVDFVATGHYAISNNGCLYRAMDYLKDQSYFLYDLRKDQLNKIIFPLGEYTKPEVREIAKKLNLPNASRKESQDLCFDTSNQSFAEMLRKRYDGESKSGDIVNRNGEPIGSHNGTYNFTIGQRRGLGLRDKPYVIGLENNSVIVDTNPKLFYRILLSPFHITLPVPLKFRIQTRYRQEPAEGWLESANVIRFRTPQYSIASGQVAVLYDDDKVVGGGIIQESFDG